MRRLSDICPYIRRAHLYHYSGGPSELTRIGYQHALHFFVEGKGKVIVEERVYPIEGGVVIFIRPGLSHSFRSDPAHALTAYHLYFDLWPGSKETDHLFTQAPSSFNNRLMPPVEPCLELEGMPERSVLAGTHLRDTFNRIVRQFNDTSSIYRKEIANSSLYNWFLEWNQELSRSVPSDFRMRAVIRDMEAHPESDWNYRTWAEHTGLNRTQFFTLFKKETGQSPNIFLIHVKIRKAQTLLSESADSVTVIAERLGYASIHYFTRQFCRVTGLTPKEYRRRIVRISIDEGTQSMFTK